MCARYSRQISTDLPGATWGITRRAAPHRSSRAWLTLRPTVRAEASSGGPGRQTLRNLPVPAAPPSIVPRPPPQPPPPPPPPPPLSATQSRGLSVQLALVVAAFGVGTAAAVWMNVSGKVSELQQQQLQQQGAIVEQLRTTPPIAVPLYGSESDEMVGWLARGRRGEEYLVRVNRANPSQLLLKSTADGRVYSLDTNARQPIDVRDAGLMREIFNNSFTWERLLVPRS